MRITIFIKLTFFSIFLLQWTYAVPTKLNIYFVNQILASLSQLGLNYNDEKQLQQKIKLDLGKRLGLNVLELSNIAEQGAPEIETEDRQYLVYYHKDNDGEIDIKGSIIRHYGNDGERLALQKLSRPLNFDFSTLSESDIAADLNSALDALKTEEHLLKNKLKPLLLKDLCNKAHQSSEPNKGIPFVIGGKSIYDVIYHISKDGKIEIETENLRDYRGQGIFLKQIPYPLNFDYSELQIDKIRSHLVNSLSENECTEEYPKAILEQIPELVHYYLSDDDDSNDLNYVPKFLGGNACYYFDYYIKDDGTPKVEGISIGPNFEENKHGIILSKQEGPAIWEFL